MRSSFGLVVVTPEVGSSPWDEAVVLIDGHEALATLGRRRHSCWIGRRPEDVIGPNSPWIASASPRDAMVARCDCSFEGCGALTARIVREGDVVIWDRFRDTNGAVTPTRALGDAAYAFDAAQYDAAVAGDGGLDSWEPITRQAATLATALLLSLDLAAHGFRDLRAHHCGESAITVRAFTVPDTQGVRSCLEARVLRHAGETAADLADRVWRYVEGGRFQAEAEVGSRFGRKTATPRATDQDAKGS
jgi:hypothetical protein